MIDFNGRSVCLGLFIIYIFPSAEMQSVYSTASAPFYGRKSYPSAGGYSQHILCPIDRTMFSFNEFFKRIFQHLEVSGTTGMNTCCTEPSL